MNSLSDFIKFGVIVLITFWVLLGGFIFFAKVG